MKTSLLVSALLALAVPAFAQSEDRAPAGGNTGTQLTPVQVSSIQLALGTQLQGPYDVTTTVTAPPTPGAAWNRELGCAKGWGYFWVSGGAGTTGAFAIHQYSLTGTYIQSFNQTVFAATVWGARDLAVDEAAFKMWGGMEGNVLAEYTFNPAGGPNGTLTFTTSYTISGGPGTIRALAYKPSTQRFYTKNFNSSLFEFTLTPPQVTNTFGGNGKASYGLAYDPANDVLWQFDQNVPVGGTAGTDAVEFNESQMNGGLTGRTFMGAVYGVAATNIAGGCDFYNDGSGVTKLLALHQNTNDELYVYEVDSTFPQPNVYCTAGTSTNGCVPAIAFSGVPSVAASSGFTISVSSVEGQKSGLLFYGVSGQTAAVWGAGSNSFLCVKSPTQRMTFQSSGGTTGLCDGSLSEDWRAWTFARPAALGQPFAVGNVIDAQAWYRDPQAVKTTNLSDGLNFTLAP